MSKSFFFVSFVQCLEWSSPLDRPLFMSWLGCMETLQRWGLGSACSSSFRFIQMIIYAFKKFKNQILYHRLISVHQHQSFLWKMKMFWWLQQSKTFQRHQRDDPFGRVACWDEGAHLDSRSLNKAACVFSSLSQVWSSCCWTSSFRRATVWVRVFPFSLPPTSVRLLFGRPSVPQLSTQEEVQDMKTKVFLFFSDHLNWSISKVLPVVF